MSQPGLPLFGFVGGPPAGPAPPPDQAGHHAGDWVGYEVGQVQVAEPFPHCGLHAFDFVGYDVGCGTRRAGGGLQLQENDVFWVCAAEEERLRSTARRNRMIQNLLRTRHRQFLARQFEEWRMNWAATYTVLLTEV